MGTAHRHDAGHRHLYQSRFRSFPIQKDGHFLTACRYVERNPLRAAPVEQAEDWPWSSLALRERKLDKGKLALDEGPVDGPARWLALVNRAQTGKELAALRQSAWRGRPWGTDAWVLRTAAKLGLESSLRPRGRRKKGRATANNGLRPTL